MASQGTDIFRDRQRESEFQHSRWLRVKTDFGGMRSEKEILVLLAGGEDGWFDGRMPYVGLDNWNRAVKEAMKKTESHQIAAGRGRGSLRFATPITYGYCLTAHKSQGSQYRRVTTYVPGDLRSKFFQKPTKLPNGKIMSFSTRWLYTAISRAIKRSTLLVSK